MNDLFQSWKPASLGSSGVGVNSATWSTTVPLELEGPYQIDVTATDTHGNRNDKRSTWGLWRGEIDTRVPRVGLTTNVTTVGSTVYTQVQGWAEDLNLTNDGMVTPCAVGGATSDTGGAKISSKSSCSCIQLADARRRGGPAPQPFRFFLSAGWACHTRSSRHGM